MKASNFSDIIEMVKEFKKDILEKMEKEYAYEVMQRSNQEDFDARKEFVDMRVEKRAFERTNEVIEIVIDRLEKGE